MIDFYPEIAPVFPVYEYSAAFEPRKPTSKRFFDITEFATPIGRWDNFYGDEKGSSVTASALKSQLKNALLHTPTLSEASQRSTSGAIAQNTALPAASSNSGGDPHVIASQRVLLMAAKYAGNVESSEIVARLEILNRRLSAIAPRVTQQQVSSLEKANDQLASIRAAREGRAFRLEQLSEST